MVFERLFDDLGQPLRAGAEKMSRAFQDGILVVVVLVGICRAIGGMNRRCSHEASRSYRSVHNSGLATRLTHIQ